MSRHYAQGNSYKRKHLIGTDLQFQKFSHIISIIIMKSKTVQVDMVLEELRVLHPGLKAVRGRLSSAGIQEEFLGHSDQT